MSRRSLAAGLLGVGLLVMTVPTPALAQAGKFLGRSVGEWQQDLGNADPVVRRSAAYALGKLSSQAVAAVPDLLRRLREDKADSVREAAACALGEIGRDSLTVAGNVALLPTLSAALEKDADPLVRRSAAVALGQFGSDAAPAHAALEKALADARPEVRQNAAWALGKLKAADSVNGLRKALSDADPTVCRDVANALGALQDAARPAVPELLACCKHADPEVKKSALGVLVQLVGPDDEKTAGPLLCQALADPDLEVRRNAALALGNIGGEGAAAAVPTLVDAMLNGEIELRRQAAAAIKNIGPAARSAVPALRKALADADRDMRLNATVALGGLAAEAAPAVPDLVKVLANDKEDVAVRVEAAVSLSRIGPVPAAVDGVPALVRVLENPATDAKVRERTLWALRVHWKRMGELPGVFPALAKVLTEPKDQASRMLRYDCAYILGGLQGPDCPPQTLDVLLEFLHDKTILIYAGTGTKVTGTGAEKETGGATVKESGKGDGRVMAILALRRVGPDRLRSRPDILNQLRAIAADNTAFPELRTKAREALTELMP